MFDHGDLASVPVGSCCFSGLCRFWRSAFWISDFFDLDLTFYYPPQALDNSIQFLSCYGKFINEISTQNI